MNTKSIIEGLNILVKYYDELEYQMGADHDIIYMAPTNKPISNEDLERLDELGWFQEDEEYNIEQEWAAYV